jgi:hypothetical protein
MAKKPMKKVTPKKKKGCPGAIPVNLTVNPNTGITVAHPSTPVHVSKKKKKQVRWNAGGAKFTIDFGSAANSPFRKWYFPSSTGKPVCSGTVIGPINTPYKYTATVDGASPLDPIIHTDE